MRLPAVSTFPAPYRKTPIASAPHRAIRRDAVANHRAYWGSRTRHLNTGLSAPRLDFRAETLPRGELLDTLRRQRYAEFRMRYGFRELSHASFLTVLHFTRESPCEGPRTILSTLTWPPPDPKHLSPSDVAGFLSPHLWTVSGVSSTLEL